LAKKSTKTNWLAGTVGVAGGTSLAGTQAASNITSKSAANLPIKASKFSPILPRRGGWIDESRTKMRDVKRKTKEAGKHLSSFYFDIQNECYG